MRSGMIRVVESAACDAVAEVWGYLGRSAATQLGITISLFILCKRFS